jgi:hypothetical protein
MSRPPLAPRRWPSTFPRARGESPATQRNPLSDAWKWKYHGSRCAAIGPEPVTDCQRGHLWLLEQSSTKSTVKGISNTVTRGQLLQRPLLHGQLPISESLKCPRSPKRSATGLRPSTTSTRLHSGPRQLLQPLLRDDILLCRRAAINHAATVTTVTAMRRQAIARAEQAFRAAGETALGCSLSPSLQFWAACCILTAQEQGHLYQPTRDPRPTHPPARRTTCRGQR